VFGRSLQVLGVLALAGLVLGSLGALLVVQRRVEVTFADGAEPARGPDAMAELRADLEGLRADVRAIGIGLAELHGALEASADERERALRSELAALRAQLGAAGEPGAPAAPPEAPVATSEPAPEKSFLAFRLPSEAFAFDRALRFELVSSLSRVGFDAESTLHDFSGATARVAGELETCLARPEQAPRGEIRVEAGALATGEAERDVEMQKALGVAEAPTLRFEWQAFEAAEVDAAAQRVRGVARGTLTIRGTSRPFAMPVRVAVDASKRLEITGEAPLSLAAFGVEPPVKLGVLSVADEVTIWIALRARAVGPAAEGAR
jgi:polyisoprenoid-binding protein YceI